MSDVVDKANEWVQQRLDDEIARRQQRVNKPVVIHQICIDCDMPIPKQRLEKMPSAPRCVECQTLHEKQEAIRGGYR